MSEKLKPNPEFEQGNLHDVSERVRGELLVFCGREDRSPAAPRDLFIRLPGRSVTAQRTIDNGCRGGWYEDYSIAPDDKPLKITTIQRAPEKNGIRLGINIPNHYTFPIKMLPDELETVEFLESTKEDDEIFDSIVKQQIERYDFTSLKNDQLASNYDVEVGVRSKYPITHPVVELQRSENIQPLEGYFETIYTYLDGQSSQTMVRIMTSTSLNSLTDWVPLEQLEFYLIKRDSKLALSAKLYAVAEKLIAGRIGVEPLNVALAETATPVVYPLPYDRRLSYLSQPAKALFVLGKVATNSAIKNLFVPTIKDRYGVESPYLRADRAVIANTQPWLVDDTTQLATPLLSPLFKTSRITWDKPIEDMTVESVVELGQS